MSYSTHLLNGCYPVVLLINMVVDILGLILREPILSIARHYVITGHPYFVSCLQESVRHLPHQQYCGSGWACVEQEARLDHRHIF